jgi:tripartite-type tricarboxylate transporter receptor subunit TctC
MKLQRRQFLKLAVGAAVPPAAERTAWAQAYPLRSVRIIVGFGPGGAADVVARLLGQSLSERLGQPFIVENRPGANTNIATEAVVRAPADGYTLLLMTSTNATNTALYEKLNFDFLHDIAPIAGIALNPGVMEVNPSFPTNNVPDFIAYAKANPGTINMATSGVGSGGHLWGELFNIMAGVNLVPVHYRGGSGAELTDLMAGQVQVTFDPLLSSIELIRTGKLRALAVTTVSRSEMLPNVPTMGEFLPGYEAIAWQGIGAPKNTPPEIVDKLNKEINAIIADPRTRARFADLTATALVKAPADFATFITEYTENWAKVIRAANIQLDAMPAR